MNLIINAAEAIGPEGGVIQLATSRWNSRNGAPGKRRPPSGGRLRLPGGLRYWPRNERGNAGPHLRSVLYDESYRPGPGTGGGKSDCGPYGGSVNLMSTPGQGTRFEILFPVPTAGRWRTRAGRPACGEEVAGHDGKGHAGRGRGRSPGRDRQDAAQDRPVGYRGERRVGGDRTDSQSGTGDRPDPARHDHTWGVQPRGVHEAQRIRPEIKIILTTAYGREAVAIFDAPQLKGFIRKPYQFADLVQLLGEALGG